MMGLWSPPEWSRSVPQLWWPPQLKLQALIGQECQAEVVAEYLDVVISDEGS